MPVLERQITATFVGGPRDGDTITFLGSIRDRLWLATSHCPGYVLEHHGDDPLLGWQLVPTTGTDRAALQGHRLVSPPPENDPPPDQGDSVG